VGLALADYLEEQRFRATVTPNGQQALEAEARDAADILLTDMIMPVINGAELIRRIRQSRLNLPIVVTTANADIVPPGEAKRMVVILKPSQLAIMVEIFQAVLNNDMA
jgi:CheY-like chemotaxis protein